MTTFELNVYILAKIKMNSYAVMCHCNPLATSYLHLPYDIQSAFLHLELLTPIIAAIFRDHALKMHRHLLLLVFFLLRGKTKGCIHAASTTVSAPMSMAAHRL